MSTSQGTSLRPTIFHCRNTKRINSRVPQRQQKCEFEDEPTEEENTHQQARPNKNPSDASILEGDLEQQIDSFD